MDHSQDDPYEVFTEEDMAWAQERFERLAPILQAHRAMGIHFTVFCVVNESETDLVAVYPNGGRGIRGRALAVWTLVKSAGFIVTCSINSLDEIMAHVQRDGHDSIQFKSMSKLQPYERLLRSPGIDNEFRTVLLASW